MRVVFLLVVLGCAGTSARPTIENQQAFVDAVLEGWRPDYRHPLDGAPERGGLWKQHVEACERGEPSACWKATLDREVAANCRAGQSLSCRALRRSDEYPDLLPGALGRRLQLCMLEHLEICDLAGLWDECIARFTRSCRALRDIFDELHIPLLGPLVREQILSSARSGCSHGIRSDCDFLESYGDDADGMFAGEVRCRNDDQYCGHLARRVFRNGDTVRAHRLLEYGCQRGHMETCEWLGGFYVRRELPEPIEGRGAHLLALACRYRIETGGRRFESDPAGYFRECMARTGVFEFIDRTFHEPMEWGDPP